MTDHHESPLGRLRTACNLDPTVHALVTMAELSGRDVLDLDVLTQIIAALVASAAHARRLLVSQAAVAPVTMVAEGPPPVRAPHLSSLRRSLAHRDAEASVNGHAPGCHAAGLGRPTTGISPGCGCPVPEADAPRPSAPGRTVGHFEVEAVRGLVGGMAIVLNLRHLDPSNVAIDGAASLLTIGARVRVVRDDDAPEVETVAPLHALHAMLGGWGYVGADWADGVSVEMRRHAVDRFGVECLDWVLPVGAPPQAKEATGPEPGAVMGPLSVVDCRVAEGGIGGPTIRLDVHLARSFGCGEVEEARAFKDRVISAAHIDGPGVWLVREPAGVSS